MLRFTSSNTFHFRGSSTSCPPVLVGAVREETLTLLHV